jgi:hypothetical protein
VHCVSRVAVAVAREHFGNPERRISAVGNRYQRTDKEQQTVYCNCPVYAVTNPSPTSS